MNTYIETNMLSLKTYMSQWLVGWEIFQCMSNFEKWFVYKYFFK